MTKIQICNMALGEIGANTITSFTGDDPETRWCSVYWDNTRDLALQLMAPSFAIERQVLVSDSEAEHETYVYHYQMPTDPLCLRFLRIADSDDVDFQIEGNIVHCNYEDATGLYVKQVLDTSQYDPAFSAALAMLLASRLASSIKKDKDLAIALFNRANVIMMTAAGAEKNEAYGHQTTSTWVEEIWNTE